MADLSVTAANVLASASAGTISYKTAAVAITRGQYIYLLAAGTVGLADANATTPANSIEGCALADCAAGQKCLYVQSDTGFTPGFSATAGDDVWLSQTAGACTKTKADLTSGATVIWLGSMTSSTVMKFAPVSGGVIP